MNRERRNEHSTDTSHLPPEQGAALRDCLERIEKGGSPESVLSQHPEHADALRPLIQTALALRALEARPAPADLASRIDLALDTEDRVVNEGAERSASGAPVSSPGWIESISAWLRPGQRPSEGIPSRPMVLRLAGAALSVLLLIYGGAFASADSLPGDRLYDLKIGIERVRLGLASPEAGAELAERFAVRRLREASILEADGRDGETALEGIEALAPWLGADRADELIEAQRESRKAAGDGSDLDAETGDGRQTDEGAGFSDRVQATAVARLERSSLLQTPTSAAEDSGLVASSDPIADPGLVSTSPGAGIAPVAEPSEVTPPSVVQPAEPEPEPDPGDEEPSDPEPSDPDPDEPEDPNPPQPDPTSTEPISPAPNDPTPSPPSVVDPALMAVVVGMVYGEGSVGTPPIPLEGAVIEFDPVPNANGARTPPPVRTKTAPGGSFEMRLQTGTYRVYIRHEGYHDMEYGERSTGSGPTPGTPITPRVGAPFQLGRIFLIPRDPNDPGPGNALDPIATRPPALGPGRPTPSPEPRQPLPVPSATLLPFEPPAH